MYYFFMFKNYKECISDALCIPVIETKLNSQEMYCYRKILFTIQIFY